MSDNCKQLLYCRNTWTPYCKVVPIAVYVIQFSGYIFYILRLKYFQQLATYMNYGLIWFSYMSVCIMESHLCVCPLLTGKLKIHQFVIVRGKPYLYFGLLQLILKRFDTF